MITPTSVATAPATSPTHNEVRMPYTRLASTLWPSLSVPSHIPIDDPLGGS